MAPIKPEDAGEPAPSILSRFKEHLPRWTLPAVTRVEADVRTVRTTRDDLWDTLPGAAVSIPFAIKVFVYMLRKVGEDSNVCTPAVIHWQWVTAELAAFVALMFITGQPRGIVSLWRRMWGHSESVTSSSKIRAVIRSALAFGQSWLLTNAVESVADHYCPRPLVPVWDLYTTELVEAGAMVLLVFAVAWACGTASDIRDWASSLRTRLRRRS